MCEDFANEQTTRIMIYFVRWFDSHATKDMYVQYNVYIYMQRLRDYFIYFYLL